MVSVAALLARDPVVLAPMEDVSDVVFRRAARSVGAVVCVTELVGAEQLIARSKLARRRGELPDDDRPTGLQIYGGDPAQLLHAARIAAEQRPAFVDLNCGCWIPAIAARGAGAGWLRRPDAMVAMARAIRAALAPLGVAVTVKTRIGWGEEAEMPIVDLARRLEDAGVAALAIHCRTALAGHEGTAAWEWAARAREAVAMPVIVNGGIASAADVVRALAITGCAGAMIGRAAIAHPWLFREARAALAGQPVAAPTACERLAMYRRLLVDNCARRGEQSGIAVTRRYVRVLGELAAELRRPLFAARSLAESLGVLDGCRVA